MVEAISKRLLIRDFGGGWLIRLWFDRNVRSLQITEMLRHKTRRVHPEGARVTHDDAAAERLFDEPDVAIRQLLALEAQRLRAELDSLRERRHSLRRRLRGWRGLRLRRDRSGELTRDLVEIERKLGTYEKQLAILGREQVGVEPLPDQIIHYGRLALGASVWVLDWADRAAGCPISEYVIAAESIELGCRSDAGSGATAMFYYTAGRADIATTWPGPLTIEMRCDGAVIPSPFGLSAHFDLAEASAARMHCLEMAEVDTDGLETSAKSRIPRPLEDLVSPECVARRSH